MSENEKNKAVVDRLAENIQTKAVEALQKMLQECIVKSRRDLLFESKEYEEEIYIVFPEFGKDLKVEPVDYKVRRGFSFAFRLSGTYAQLQPCEYIYEYIGSQNQSLKDQLKKIGIIDDYKCYRGPMRVSKEELEGLVLAPDFDRNTLVTNYIELARPYRHKYLQFHCARLENQCVKTDSDSGSLELISTHEPVKELGRGHFEMPVNVSFRLEKGEFRFDKIYFTDPNGNQLTDIYNNEICVMQLKEVFVIKKSEDSGKPTISFKKPDPGKTMVDPYGGETLGLAMGVVEEDELKGDAGDIDLEDINIPHGQLAESLFEKLEEKRFHLESLEGDTAETTEKTPEERAKDILSDFAVYQYEINRLEEKDPHYRDLKKARYNLLIRANKTETDCALEFVDILRKNIIPSIEDDKCIKYKEKEARSKLIRDDFADADLIVIYDCMEKPVLRTDDVGDGSAMERVKKDIEQWEDFWGSVAAAAAEEGAARLIVIADDIAYRSIIRYNQALLDVVVESHLRLREMTPEDVCKLFMEKLKRSTFGKTMSEEAKTKVEKYIRDIYPKSDLRGREFIDKTFEKMCWKYFLKDNKDDSLTDCIPSYQVPSVDKILNELKQKAGLEDVVKKFENIYAMKDVLVKAGEPYHMSFEGNPGTGKTMVARMMAEMLWCMGVIKRPILKEAGAGDFKSHWSGGTDRKVRGLIREAYGGVLFIDEAYMLANDEFQEGLSILLTEMADWENPERPVVILAGYEESMHDLLKANKGLESRIKDRVTFRDYNRDELKTILTGRLEELEFKVEDSEEAEDLLEKLILEKMSSEFFGNARDMMNLAYELTGKWGETKAENKTEEKIIRAEHIKALLPEINTESIERILEDQPDLKEEFERFKTGVAYKKALKKDMDHADIPAVNLHMLFMGNPGTGKTTVAGMLADYLCGMGVLPTNKVISVEAKDLLAHDKKMTPAEHTEEYIRRAKGGILFIDEAYSLIRNDAEEVIQVLLTAMEKYKENTIFVFAGYPREMYGFLGMNPGLKSRIGYTFRFRSYETDTLVKMFINKMKDIGLYFEEEDAAKKKLEDIMRFFRRMEGFGNGRFVENLLNAAMGKHGARLAERYPGDEKNPPLQDCPPEQLNTYTADDLPSKEEILKSFYGIDCKVEEYEEKEKETTIIHELGHATVRMAANPRRIREGIRVVEKITVKADYKAYGCVSYTLSSEPRTEKDYKVSLASLLGGRNAEKMYFEGHTPGCRTDYEMAKRLAKRMIEEFAMGDLGVTTETDLLREADILATDLIKENKAFIDTMKHVLMKYEEMEGEDIEGAYRAYMDGMEKLRDYLDSHYPIDDADKNEKNS